MPTKTKTRKKQAATQHKVLIVDDHPIVRRGLSQLLDQETEFSVCGEAGSATEALDILDRARPDVVLVDITLEGVSGIELIKTIHQRQPEMPMLVLSMHDENLYAERALRAGAKGYIMKQEASEKVVTAIRTVLRGELYVSQNIASRMLEEFVGGLGTDNRRFGVDRLSDRELEVFEWLGHGLSTSDIADKLHLSVKTIETYRAHIKDKLKLKNATELVHHAVHWVQNKNSLG
jgi:DNA-binding NarL/FixJ family response regulator